jgi:ribonuclease HI
VWLDRNSQQKLYKINCLSPKSARGHHKLYNTAEPEGLEGANALARKGPNKVSYDTLDLKPDAKFNLTGGQLSTMSQALAYQDIQEGAPSSTRFSMTINLDITRYAVKRVTGHLPTDTAIWLSIQSKDITRTIRVFLWKVIHNAHKCGDYWLKIPDFEH